jgi:hypothetical protein
MWWPRPTCRTSAYAYSLLRGRTGVGAEDEAPWCLYLLGAIRVLIKRRAVTSCWPLPVFAH